MEDHPQSKIYYVNEEYADEPERNKFCMVLSLEQLESRYPFTKDLFLDEKDFVGIKLTLDLERITISSSSVDDE